MKTQITEEQKAHTEWYEQAKIQTLKTLPTFLSHLMDDYGHDYSTVCHALSAGAIATAWAMNKHDSGGITGFQAGAVMWEFIRNWSYSDNKTGLKIVDYDKMLFPQYEESYQKTISQSTFSGLQKEAIRKIEEADANYQDYLTKKKEYDVAIKKFIKKYPDYLERKEHYDRLLMGNGEQWDAYNKKKESGFDFAPDSPYCGITSTHVLYIHWQRIIAGVVPFGFTIE